MTTRCPTTSGPFRCEKEAGHQGECECEAGAYATARLPCVTQIQAVPVAEPRTLTEEPKK